MIGRAFGAVLMAVALAAPAWAAGDEPEYSKAYDGCMAQSSGITVTMRDCISAEQGRQDKQLDAVYRELSAKSDRHARAALVQAERAWVAFRKAQCVYAGEQEFGGTLGPVLIASCFLETTARRLQDLRKYVKAEHGFAE
jgi:uncharacterized protein YecT (DUF1311 family)